MARNNTMDMHQFRGGYIPQQPVDEFDRKYVMEPNPPSKKRSSVQYGAMSEARPGLAGMQDYKRKKGG